MMPPLLMQHDKIIKYSVNFVNSNKVGLKLKRQIRSQIPNITKSVNNE